PEHEVAEVVVEVWPERPVRLGAFDINSRRRVVLSGPQPQAPSLMTSVLASCAIPGLYRPVRVADHTLVDGGVLSSTNLDLAASRQYAVVVAVAPMSCDPSLPAGTLFRMGRYSTVRQVKREAAMVRAVGPELLLISPRSADLKIHGRNLMRPSALTTAGRVIAQTAYEETARALGRLPVEALLA